MKLTAKQKDEIEDVLLDFALDFTDQNPHSYIKYCEEAINRIEAILNE